MIAVRTKPSRESMTRLWKVQTSPVRSIIALSVFLLIMIVTVIFAVVSFRKGDGNILLVVLAVVTACSIAIILVRTLRYPAKRFAVDVNTIDDAFGYTAEAAWLAEHAHEYGFIIRYPLGKEDITGYQYEPWHIRYVGSKIADKIYKTGQCLEEYLKVG